MNKDERPPEGTEPTSADRQEPDGTPAKRLGDFELLRELGRGGMGVVYEARQISLHRRVALKVLPPGLGLTETAVHRFEREARAAAKLHHTNIVPVHAIGEEEGSHYYAMELIEGDSLSRVLNDLRGQQASPLMEAAMTQTAATAPAKQKGEESEPSSPTTSGATSLSDSSSSSRHWFDTVARLLADVADALHYAHGRGVIHRDVKPANLMLSSDGRLCLTDFGLARVTQEPGMTVSGSFLGTPAYMSPEQIAAGRVQVDARSDIYSLGAVLYEMLCLRRPFTGESRDVILSAIMTKDPRPPRRFNPRIPVDLETICQKAMEKDRDRRYQSAAEFANDLRQYLQRGLITARRAGLARRTWKSIRRHPVAATVTAAVVVLALSVGGVTHYLSGQRTHESARRAVSEARLFMARGEYNQGLRSTDEALALLPDFQEGRVLRARLLIKLNRAPDAVEEARAVLEQNPDDWTAHLVMAMAGRYEQNVDVVFGIPVEEHLAAVERLAPDSPDALFLRALIADSAREAVALLDRALEQDPSHFESLFERTLRHEQLKNYPAALLDGERLAALRPRSAEGHRVMGWIHAQLHDRERALEEYERALQINPNELLTHRLRAVVFRSLGRYEEEIAGLTRALEIDPQYEYGYVHRANAYIQLGRYDEALEDARRALELQPDLAYAYRIFVQVLWMQGKQDEVAEVIERAREASRGWTGTERQADLQIDLSLGYAALGNYEQALTCADRAVELLPDKHDTIANRARVHLMMGNEAGFEKDCAAAAELPVDEPAELSSRASWLAWTCRLRDLALRDYDEVIRLAPWWADPYSGRAGVLKHEKRFEEALADYGKAIELAPAWSEAYHSRALLLKDLDRFEEVLADTDRYIELGDDSENLRWLRAEALLSLGRVEEAFAEIDRIGELNPESGQADVYRGFASEQLGRLREAEEAFGRALEKDSAMWTVYVWRAEVRLSSPGRCDEAIADLRKFEELSGGQLPWVKNRLAVTHSVYLVHHCPEQYDPELALELAEQSYRQQPDSGPKQTYGWALYRNGRYEEARQVLLEAMSEEVTEWPPTLAFLSMTHYRLGLEKEARHYYDRTVARMRTLNTERFPLNTLLLDEAARMLGIQRQGETVEVRR